MRRPPGSSLVTVYLARRISTLVATLIAASLVVFALLAVLPGKPAQVILGTQATPESVAQLTKQLGLDKPLWQQYLDWMRGLVTGDYGNSYISQLPIGHQIAQSLAVTAPLVGLGLAVGLVIAVPFGVAAALLRRRAAGTLIAATSQVGIAIPNFIAGILLILVFAVKLGWLPAFGRGDVVALGWWTTGFLTKSGLASLILPTITLCLFQLTLIMRLVRSEMLEVLRTDYIKFARARGLTDRAINFGHALKNTLVPVITITGLQLGSIIAFSIITEQVFQWPGMGLLFIQAVSYVDIPVMAAYLCLIAVVFVTINLIVDLLYYVVDPRLRVDRPGGTGQ